MVSNIPDNFEAKNQDYCEDLKQFLLENLKKILKT